MEFASDWRPIPLSWRFVRYRRATEKPALLAEELRHATKQGGRSLVFVQSRRRAEGLSRQLQEMGIRAGHHHAGLQHVERQEVEGAFRGGNLDALVATATLEMGVNLPVRQVVLYDLQAFDGLDFRPLPTNNVWQRVGRAGRRGLDETGEAVLFAPVWERDVERYKRGDFEPVRSPLAHPRALGEQLVAELASGLCRTPDQLQRALGASLAAQQKLLPDVTRLLDEMKQAGMVTETLENDSMTPRLRATRLGRIASRHLLEPASVATFRRALQPDVALQTSVMWTFFDLLLLLSASRDCEPVLPVDFEELEDLESALHNEPSQLLSQSRRQITSAIGCESRRLLAALKMALVLRDWTRCGEESVVAERYGCYPFEVACLAESAARLLMVLSSVLDPEEERTREDKSIVSDEQVTLREKIRALRVMVSTGLDEGVATLTFVPSIGPSMARRLALAGICDVEDLALGDGVDMAKRVPGLSLERANRWIALAVELVRTRSAFSFREGVRPVVCDTLATPIPWPGEIDPYRLRRALELQVARHEESFEVWGGSEPHRVNATDEGLQCDCADAETATRLEMTQVCKHVLRVRLWQGDSHLEKFAARLGKKSDITGLDVFALWFEGRDLTP